ncbi:aminotransferase class IV [Bradyrhizobium manausense]|uniref:aminotransferase class IV n=1 Tax=Bradyrhizobium manausense TaxID=989370 RepID=UPI001BA7D9B2|nr:aminotransferase class IV [Bradyrhizobium manausense]MBR0793700.1 aminotransferase class IV [Bradyrhizobium manausense]
MSVVWLNGSLVDQSDARVSVADRGFTLADGLFETIKAVGSRPFWLAEHFARLKAGAAEIGLAIPFSEDRIFDAADRLLAGVASEAQSALRLTVTRGAAARGLWPKDAAQQQPTCVLTVAPSVVMPPQAFVVCRSTCRNERSPLSRIKSLGYGDNILARREAIDRGADDAIMLNTKGHVACATVGNIFFRVDGRWVTPPRDDGILAGLARKRFIAELGAAESSVTTDMIRRSDAGFVCNSLGFSLIKSIDGRDQDQADLPTQAVYSP